MNDQITKTPLDEMRLPELQARYAEVFGEATKCPNRKWLIRRLNEAAAQDLGAGDADVHADTVVEPAMPPSSQDEPIPPAPNDDEPTPAPKARLTKLSVPELRSLYAELLGKETVSQSKAYLVWRVRQAQNGKLPARVTKPERAEPRDFKVLPLRLEADFVAQIDEAWKRMGLRSRTELFRRAVGEFMERSEGSQIRGEQHSSFDAGRGEGRARGPC